MIEMSIQVIIAHPNAHTGLLHAIFTQGRTSQNSLFAKSSITIVHEQETGSGVTGDVNVLPPVFIKIRRYDGHAVGGCGSRDAGLLRYISERSIAIVSIKGMPARG